MEEISLQEYIDVLMSRKRTIAVVTLAVVLITGIILAVMPRTYEGETSLLFPQQSSGGIGAQIAQITGLSLPTELSGRDVYTMVLKSRTVGMNVYERCDLGKYDLKYKDFQKNLTLEMPREGGLILSYRVPTSWLMWHVPTRQIKQRTSALAAQIANTYIDELYIYDKTNTLFMGRKNRIFIEKQLERTKAELSDAEDRLQKFQEEHPTLAPPDKSSEYVDQAMLITTKQTETATALREIKGQLMRARATWSTKAPQNVLPEAVIDTPAISSLGAELANLEVRRATLLEDYYETHPDVVSLTQEIEKTQEKIRSEVARVVSGKAGSASPAHQELLKQMVLLEINRDGLEARRSALASAMSGIESQLSGLPVEEMEYTRLLRQVKAAETVYTTLLAEHAKARVAEGRDTSGFIVLDEALASEKPVKPRVKLTLAASLVLGIMLGIVTASFQGVIPRKPSA